MGALLYQPNFRTLIVVGSVLALVTVSDSLLYLVLQERLRIRQCRATRRASGDLPPSCEGIVNLASCFLERSGTIDLVIGEAALFFHRHLRRYAARGLFGRETTIDQALELLLGSAPCHGQPAESLEITCLNVQRRNYGGNVRFAVPVVIGRTYHVDGDTKPV